MKKSLPRLDSKFIVIAISVLLLLYFIVFPLLVLIYDSLFIDGAFDISNYKDVYGKKVNWKALTNTIHSHSGCHITLSKSSLCNGVGPC